MEEKSKESPLVSIVVVTYNSAKYVIETLNSANAQTYKNIELIVTDDCSTDNTVEIAENWIIQNKSNFKRVKIIKAKINTGIPANCNRGVRESTGDWLKLIAGDDLLLKDCISEGINYINLNRNTKIFASNVQKFTDSLSESADSTMFQNLDFFNQGKTAEFQLRKMLVNNPVFAPSVFISRQLFELNNGFDESIPFLEDYPFWIKTLQLGIRIDFLEKTTVAYRQHEDSISGFNSQKIFNDFYIKYFKFQKNYTFKFMNLRQRFNQFYLFWIKSLFDKVGLNDRKFLILYKIAWKINIFNEN